MKTLLNEFTTAQKIVIALFIPLAIALIYTALTTSYAFTL